MDFRRVGNSGLKVSALAYGNWITHGNQVEYDQAKACVHAALDAGITTFDTADVYAEGRAEAVLGESLFGLERSSFEVCTKVYFPTGRGANERGLSRKHILESCDASLQRLKVEHIDLFQAHMSDSDTPLEETLDAFDHLVRQGKVLYLGVSNWTVELLKRAREIADERGFHHIVSNQPQYSLLSRGIESEIVPYCAQVGISQVVWSPLAQGVLTGKYLPGQASPPESRAAGSAQDSLKNWWLHDDILTAVQRLVPIAASVNLSMAQLALAWILKNPNVASAIIGASRPEQISENEGALGAALDQSLMEEIDTALGDIPFRESSRLG